MNTAETIQQTESELHAANWAVEAAQRAFEVAAKTGGDCIKERAQQRQAGEEVERLAIRLDYLREQLDQEKEQARIDQAATKREQVIGCYGDLLRDYTAIKAAAGKLQAQLQKFNQAAAQLIEVDMRQLKQLGSEPLPREVAQTFIGKVMDVSAINAELSSATYCVSHSLESAAHQLK